MWRSLVILLVTSYMLAACSTTQLSGLEATVRVDVADTPGVQLAETPTLRPSTLTPTQTSAPTVTLRPADTPTPIVAEVTPLGVYTITSPQRTVNAVLSLARHLQVPDHLLEGDSVKTEDDFDVNSYFTVLDHLSMEPGYVLDYVYLSDGLGGKPMIYARASDQMPYATYAEYVDAVDGVHQRSYEFLEHAYDYLEHVQTDETADGYFQLVVLATMGDQFYLDWHALYNDATIICDREGLETALSAADAFSAIRVPLSVRRSAEALDLEPSVEFKDEVAVVRSVVFTKWGGFIELQYTISRGFPHTLIDSEVEMLVEYDCGIQF